MPALPRIVCTIGMHGSASTWVFNMAREILTLALGGDAVLPLFADQMAHLPPEAERDGKALIIKSHEGSAALEQWLDEHDTLRLLSVRDPRDATLSLMLRFGMKLQPAANAIARDGMRLQRLAARGIPVWRYEDGFFRQEAALDALAARLGCGLAPQLRTALLARYSTDSVRAFAQNIEALPPERLTKVGNFTMDRVTQILAPHIGDAGSGKFRTLPEALQPQLTRFFMPLLTQFGYPP
jgi:hypothetical protein